MTRVWAGVPTGRQCFPIDRGTRRPLGGQPDEALLDLLDALECRVPPRLQLPRHMPFGGINQFVAAGREPVSVLRLLKLAFDGAPMFDRRSVDLLCRLQRRLHSMRRDRVQHARGDRSIDAQPADALFCQFLFQLIQPKERYHGPGTTRT